MNSNVKQYAIIALKSFAITFLIYLFSNDTETSGKLFWLIFIIWCTLYYSKEKRTAKKNKHIENNNQLMQNMISKYKSDLNEYIKLRTNNTIIENNENSQDLLSSTPEPSIKNSKQNLMTDNEYLFYRKLQPLLDKYAIIPQYQLSNSIGKEGVHYIIDYAFFTKDYKNLLLLVELNDSSHKRKDRAQRDKIVKLLCEKYNIKLLIFYSKYPNKQEYVCKRIEETINQINETNNLGN